VVESKLFPFLTISVYDFYDPVKTRLLESEAEAEEPTNHKAGNQVLLLVYSSASDSDSLLFTRS